MWGEELTRPQVDDIAREYLQRNGLSQLVRVRWSASHLLTSFGSSCLNLVDRPGYYRTKRLLGLLDHELGTNFTRAHNFKFSLCGHSTVPKTSSFLSTATEERLASLNKFFRDKALFQPALL